MTSAVAVYCDFDGTVTADVVDILLTDLADPRWREIEAQWVAGRIGSRECLARQIPLIRGGWPAIIRQLRDVRLEPTFRSFAAWCRASGIRIQIVSDGLDRVIQTLLDREGVVVDGVWANHLEESPAGQLGIGFPYPPTRVRCRAGLCKCQLIERGSARTLSVVIGDGRSDFCWAAQADWLFAKSNLLAHCREQGIPCTPFHDFDAIREALNCVCRDRGAPVVRTPAAATHA